MALDFTLVQLRYFQEVARRENMTEAAKHLNVTQSAISTAVAQLERVLGIDLFIRRRNRSVFLSTAGKRFLAEVNAVLEATDALGETALGLARSLSGDLTVGVFSPIAPTRLPLIHDEFERRYPDVRVNYLEADLQDLQRAVLAGDCDLALTYTLGLSDRFDAYLIDVVEPHVLVSQHHRLGGRGRIPAPVHLRELADEDYIQLDLPFSRQYYDELFRIAGIAPRVRHSFSGYETVRSFVAMGHGYSLLSQSVSSGTYIGSKTVDVPLLDDFPTIDLAFVWPRELRLSRRARAFCELTEEILGRPDRVAAR
ncbi:LysR substrate-binding domain-containing protein [Brevibacterium sp. XM4083]|uniref:LysR substrate-binding domain-containing protein n=1 Tax=Brevibacterium sp. XM4083 TaxID=2583238 RepID=UPI00112E9D97|nr:LysR substrate-binding domain-containing protein [Brevibacterium sp. XM4083]MCM1013023.1 LysR substrate-binding domain-containing protein [Brevibacterium sp. XM4083]